LLFCYYC